MSAPERICLLWDDYNAEWSVFTTDTEPDDDEDSYIRADIHEAARREARDAALVELEAIAVAHEAADSPDRAQVLREAVAVLRAKMEADQ